MVTCFARYMCKDMHYFDRKFISHSFYGRLFCIILIASYSSLMDLQVVFSMLHMIKLLGACQLEPKLVKGGTFTISYSLPTTFLNFSTQFWIVFYFNLLHYFRVSC